MTDIKLKSYRKDTLLNLEKLLNNFSKKWVKLLDYKEHVETMYSTINDKNVIFIWWSQISGSVSPFMHTYSSYINKKPLSYILFDMEKEKMDLKNIFNYIKNNDNILGANITMPYKIEIFKLLEKTWELDKSAKLTWAVNTLGKVKWKLTWINTDLYWILEPIRQKIWDKNKECNKWYIMWSWWAARAAVWALLHLWITDITIFNRTWEKLVELKKHFDSKEISSLFNKKYNISIIKYDQNDENNNSIIKFIEGKWILINTLPFWFNEKLPKLPILESELVDILPKISLYFDLVYSIDKKYTPIWEIITKKYPHIKLCDWIDMVIAQAWKWFNMWSWWNKFNEEKIKKILKLR